MSNVGSKRREGVKILRALVRSELTEFLKSRGFEREKGDSLTYCYRRRRADDHDLIEIQFSKHQTPKFKINLGTLPNTGIVDWLGRLIPSDEVRIYQLERQAELCSFSIMKLIFGWFEIGCFSIFLPELVADRQICKVESLFFQADRWFKDGQKGANIRIIEYSELSPNALRRELERDGAWPPDYWTRKDEEAARRADDLANVSERSSREA